MRYLLQHAGSLVLRKFPVIPGIISVLILLKCGTDQWMVLLRQAFQSPHSACP